MGRSDLLKDGMIRAALTPLSINQKNPPQKKRNGSGQGGKEPAVHMQTSSINKQKEPFIPG